MYNVYFLIIIYHYLFKVKIFFIKIKIWSLSFFWVRKTLNLEFLSTLQKEIILFQMEKKLSKSIETRECTSESDMTSRYDIFFYFFIARIWLLPFPLVFFYYSFISSDEWWPTSSPPPPCSTLQRSRPAIYEKNII